MAGGEIGTCDEAERMSRYSPARALSQPLANEVENVCVGGILGESGFECKALFPKVINIQLFRERLSEKMCTRQPRKVIWDMINTLFLTAVRNDCSCRTSFCCFPLALANICPWPLVPIFQISLENRADKTTHNTFRDCRVHFFRQRLRQPFSKQLYIYSRLSGAH